jgi:hypothetical protein
VRIYSEASEETVRARRLLTEWRGEGLLCEEQYQRLEQDTVSELRTTNIFLRVVLFFFSMIVAGAAVALFFTIFLPHPSEQTTGIFFLIFAAVCYAAAEIAVRRARLYRYGIEEAVAICSVALLCVGLDFFFFHGPLRSSGDIEFVIPSVGAVASLWIWHRFNLWYAFPAAMIFAVFVPGYWTVPHSAQHGLLAGFYVAGLVCFAAIRSGRRFDTFEKAYSLAEAFLWLGIYLSLNLKISDLGSLSQWWGSARPAMEFAVPFYWTTWVLTWCVPPLIFARGVRQKDRLIVAVAAITSVLTLVTNKPYLGWPRHTWDPMLLGVALTGVAWFLRRWLARGPGGVRHGFTAVHLSAREKHAMSVGSAVLGLVTPQAIMPAPQSADPDFQFGGGESGGGGAGGNF